MHVTEEMEGGCHTTVNIRSEGSPAHSAQQVLLLSVLVLFIQPGWRQEPHQNKLAKGTFHLWKEHGISQGKNSRFKCLHFHQAAGILSSAPPPPLQLACRLRAAVAPVAQGQPWSSVPASLEPCLFAR